MRSLGIILAAVVSGFCILTVAVAQQRVQTTRPPPVNQGQTVTTPNTIPTPTSYAELQQQVQTLTNQLATTRDQNLALQQQVRALRLQISQMTHPGGSLVHAYCVNEGLSRNTSGAQTACGHYDCEPVSGLCRDSCQTAQDCSSDSVCDTGRCELISSYQ